MSMSIPHSLLDVCFQNPKNRILDYGHVNSKFSIGCFVFQTLKLEFFSTYAKFSLICSCSLNPRTKIFSPHICILVLGSLVHATCSKDKNIFGTSSLTVWMDWKKRN